MKPSALTIRTRARMARIARRRLVVRVRPMALAAAVARGATGPLVHAQTLITPLTGAGKTATAVSTQGGQTVVSTGPYRYVRHPMYLGYFITQVAFLLANLTISNVIKYFVAWAFQILRIREEEKLLMRDEAYADYSTSVRHRLIPGVY